MNQKKGKWRYQDYDSEDDYEGAEPTAVAAAADAAADDGEE